MTDAEKIALVTEALMPEFVVGTKVTVTWETLDFKRAVITKIEKGRYYIQSLDTKLHGVASLRQLRHLQ